MYKTKSISIALLARK